jgi:hypothetical protein
VTRRLRTAAPAVDELSDAVRWYEGRRVGLGGELFDAVTQAIELIESHQRLASPHQPTGKRGGRSCHVSRTRSSTVFALTKS